MLASASTTPSRPVDAASQIKASRAYRQAICLARRMRDALRPHTKDRKWNFKTYKNCFMASHAVSWAMDNFDVDEKMAVDRLNQLVNFGLLMQVVDPSKEFLVGETNTLFFRMARNFYESLSFTHFFSIFRLPGTPRVSTSYSTESILCLR